MADTPQTGGQTDLRDQIAQALRPEVTLSLADFHRAEAAVLAVVAPLLAAKDTTISTLADELARVNGTLGELDRVAAAERDRLSALLRGMARRSSMWRRISYKRINRLLAATTDLTQERADVERLTANVETARRDVANVTRILRDLHVAAYKARLVDRLAEDEGWVERLTTAVGAAQPTLAKNGPDAPSPQVTPLAKPRRHEAIDPSGLHTERTDGPFA